MNDTARVLADLQNAAAKARTSLMRAGKAEIQRDLDAARTRAAVATLNDALKAVRQVLA